MSEPKIFTPHELRTIEVDVEKKIFRVNGEDFGDGCTSFAIYCDGEDDFKVRMEIATTVVYAAYDGIRRVSLKEYPAHVWTPSGITVCEEERKRIGYSWDQLLEKLYRLFLHVFDPFLE